MPRRSSSVLAPAAPPAEAGNEELVRWTFDVINTHDVTALHPYWRDTIEYFPTGVRRGPAEIAAYFEEAFAAMPDLRLDIQDLAAEGDRVFVRWRLSGHFTGESYLGIAANGKRIELDGIDNFVWRDGAIVSNHVVFDQLEFVRQLGMLPRDGTLQDRVLKTLFNAKTGVAGRLRRPAP